MKNAFARFAILLAALAPILHAADEDVAGFVRLSETPATDNRAWDDPARFTDVPLVESIAFSGQVEAANGSVITAQRALWRPQEFVYAAGDQPRRFSVEVIDGAAAGAKFDITANSGNTITVDLAGGSLAGIAQGDTICISSKWSLKSALSGRRKSDRVDGRGAWNGSDFSGRHAGWSGLHRRGDFRLSKRSRPLDRRLGAGRRCGRQRHRREFARW